MIRLDARLLDAVDSRAFRAVLRNGHEIVAYLPSGRGAVPPPMRGQTVQVALSPFDMSAGRIVGLAGETDHEG